jgi:D-alanine-D-alanine ligase
MKIGFTYNVRRTKPSLEKHAQDEAEFDEPSTIAAISSALHLFGYDVLEIEANEQAYLTLLQHKNELDFVFNIAEGLHGDIREAQIPAMLEMLQIAYTHSQAMTHAISLDKELTKHVWRSHGLPTPRSMRIFHSQPVPETFLVKYPIVIKPNAEGSSKGIFNNSIVFTDAQAKEAIRNLRALFPGGDILLEEYLPGREFSVTVMGNPGVGSGVYILPPVEQNYDIFPPDMNTLASYEAKWFFEDTLSDPHSAYICPPKITKQLYTAIESVCIKAYNVLRCRDISRIDLRLDKAGNPSLLEINTLPGMIPDPNVVSYYPVAARALGWSYEQMVGQIVEHARERMV